MSLQEASLSSVTDGGAPRPDWKATVQEPSIVVRVVSVGAGSFLVGAAAGLRKTTKTAPQGSRVRGTMVWPDSMA